MRTIGVRKIGKVDKLGDLGHLIYDEDDRKLDWRGVRIDEGGHLIVTPVLGLECDLGPGRIIAR